MIYETRHQDGSSDDLNATSKDPLDNVVVTGSDFQNFASRMPAGDISNRLRHFDMSLRLYGSVHTQVTGDLANGSRPEVRDLDRARQWGDSGLQLSRLSEPRYPVLVASSLVNSISTGRIKALEIVDEQTGTALRDFTEYALRVSVKIGDEPLMPPAKYNNSDWGRTPSGMPYADFIATALDESSSSDFRGKYIHGPQYERLLEPHKKAVSELADMGVDANPAVFHPIKYQDLNVRDYVESLDGFTQLSIDRMKRERRDALVRLGDGIYQDDGRNLLSPNVLDDPGYCRQAREDSCAATSFRMMFKGVTGEALNDWDIEYALNVAKRPVIQPAESYLNILDSDAFKQEYDGRVMMRMFAGMDMSTIAKIATTVKAKRVAARVFAVVNLNSETMPNGTWHTNVLLSVNKDSVITHDPAQTTTYGRPNRHLDKEDFYRRWAATGNSGYMVVVP